MTIKSVLIIIICLLFYAAVSGQSKPSHRHVEIVFDSEGKIIAFPPAVLKQRKAVAFKVKVPMSYLDKEKDQFLKSLQQTQKALTPQVDTAYRCLLGASYVNYQKFLALIIDAIKAKGFVASEQQLTAAVLDSNKHYIPAGAFVRRMLDSQFQVQIYNGTNFLDTINLKRVYEPGNYVYFEAEKTFRGRKYKEQMEESVTAENEYKFVLQRHDPFNETVLEWYNGALENLPSMDTELISAGLKGFGSSSSTILDKSVEKIDSLKPWFTSWLWYTHGALTLNPFLVLTDDYEKSLADTIDEKTRHMSRLQIRKQFIDSSIAQLRAREYNLQTLERLQNDAVTVSEAIKGDSIKLSLLSKIYTAGTSLISKISTVPQLYTGMLYTSSLGNVTVMKQFDAAIKYRLVYKNAHTFIVNKWSKERVTEVPENEKVILMVQNTAAEVKLSIDEKRQDFEDLEAFTKLTTELLAQVDFTSTLSATGVSALEAFARGFVNKGVGGPTHGASKGITYEYSKLVECDSITPVEKNMLMTLAKNTNGLRLPYDLEPIDLKNASTPAYSAYVQQAALDKYEAPFRDSISIQDVTKPSATKDVAKSFLKIGALRHAQIAAGIAIAHKPVSTNTIDTSGNGFRVSASDNASNAIVGFKLYPLKTYNRDNSIIPRYPLRRLSAFGGFDMLHPLNNFYLGGSYDIVPGLAFTIGNNYYKQTSYTVANNKVTDTKTRYASGGTFYAVTVNPILFVQIIKTFFK